MQQQKRRKRTQRKRLINLLNKELRLPANPLSFLFLILTGTTLLPGYPILVGAMFVCLGIFYSFQAMRENNDLLYTVLLPIPKRDAVTAKYLFSCLIQGIAFLLTILFTALRMTVLSDGRAYTGNVLMPANPVFLGFTLLIFAAFNVLFLGGFFKSGGGIGRPFLAFLAAAVVLMALGETLHHLPGLSFLRAIQGRELLLQWPILLVCALAWGIATLRAWRLAQTRFVKMDL